MTIFFSHACVQVNCEHELNPMPYLYLTGSAFLVSFTAPNKQLPKPVFKPFGHVSNSYKKYKLTPFL